MATIAWIDSEDDFMLGSTKQHFLRAGHEVLSISSIPEAKNRLPEICAADVVLLELVMQGKDILPGLTFLREFVQQSERPPVIIFSSAADWIADAECKKLGVKERLLKPMPPRRLREAVEKVCELFPKAALG